MKLEKFMTLSLVVMVSAIAGCSKETPVPGPEPIVNPSEKVTLDFNSYDLQNNSLYTVNATPSTGKPKMLIVPVWFTDSSAYITTEEAKEQVRQDIGKAYLGTEEETGWESVATYYKAESLGALELEGTLTDWYETTFSSTNVTSSWNSVSILKDAVNWYFGAHPEENRRDYDSDSDGYLDGVILIYAAPDHQAKKLGNSNLWAYTYWAQDSSLRNVDNPGPNPFFWASYDFMYFDKTLTEYFSGSQSTPDILIDTHTFIHEMGHMFGLNDYYDYSSQYKPAGAFSMQDYNVGAHDAYSLIQLGWAKPYIPQETGTYTLQPTATSGDCIILSTHNEDLMSPFDEYLLLEFFAPVGMNYLDCQQVYDSGYPQGPKAYGIRLWHVDARLTKRENGHWSETAYMDPTVGNVDMMMTNTYFKSDSTTGHESPLGSDYGDYNELQLIRKNDDNRKNLTTHPISVINGMNYFYTGNSFSMSDEAIQGQFVHAGLMNTENELGWTFTVDEVDKEDPSDLRLKVTVTRVDNGL